MLSFRRYEARTHTCPPPSSHLSSDYSRTLESVGAVALSGGPRSDKVQPRDRYEARARPTRLCVVTRALCRRTRARPTIGVDASAQFPRVRRYEDIRRKRAAWRRGISRRVIVACARVRGRAARRSVHSRKGKATNVTKSRFFPSFPSRRRVKVKEHPRGFFVDHCAE